MAKPLTIQFTQIDNLNGLLTKHFYHNQETNKIIKKPNPIFYNCGTCTRKVIEFSNFPAYIKSLTHFQAITLGIVKNQLSEQKITIIPKSELENNQVINPLTILKNKDTFKFPELNALCVFKVSSIEGGPTIQVLLDKLYKLANLYDKAIVFAQSNGTGIFDKKTNKCINNLESCHLYFIVKNIENLNIYIEILKKRAWLIGQGYIHISENGKQHIRNYLFDDSTFSPDRLNYIANAKCDNSIYQQRSIKYYNGKVVGLSNTDINSMRLGKREEQKYQELVNKAKEKIKYKSDINKEKWINNILSTDENTLTRDQLYDKLNFKLCQDDVLNFDKFGLVKVSEIFNDPKKYNSATLSDPLDPENNKGKAKLYTLTSLNKPQYPFIINSYFNGKQIYNVYQKIMTENEAINIIEDITNNKIDKTNPKAIEAINILKDNDKYNKLIVDIDTKISLETSKQQIINMYKNKNKTIIFLDDYLDYQDLADLIDKKLSTDPKSLTFRDDDIPLFIKKRKRINNNSSYISILTITDLLSMIKVFKPDKNNSKYIHVDIQDRTIKIILRLNNSNFKQLNKITNNPYPNHEFNIITKQGYIPELEIYQDPINSDVGYNIDGWSLDRAKKSLDWLCDTLFSKFHFKRELDKMGAVGALLTGLIVPVVNGFPGFLITASTSNCGKSTLTNIIDNLLNNEISPIREYNQNKAELDKYISSALLKKRPVISFDNLKTGMTIDSTKLMALITGKSMDVRVMGALDTVKLDANALYLFNGIDIKMTSDFDTRLIIIHLKPLYNYSDKNKRNSNDEINKLILNNRNKIMCCLLDIILAGKNCNNIEYKGEDRFPDWNKFVCAPIYKLTGLDIRELSNSNDRQSDLYNFLSELFNEFGNKFTAASDIINKCFDSKQQLTLLGNTLQNLIDSDNFQNNTIDEITPKFVTSCLKRHLGSPIKDFKLDFTNKINHTAHWRVQK